MLTLNLIRPAAAIFAVAVALSATGCSSARDQDALASLRSFTLSTRTAAFAVTTARHTVAIQRHAREHALSSVRPIQPLRHQTARSL